MNGARMGIDERAYRRVPFRDPRPFVQQARRLEKCFKINFQHAAAQGLKLLYGDGKQPFVFRVAKELQVIRPWDTETQAGERLVSHLARVRVGGIEAFRRIEHQRRILGGQRENRDAIE